MILHRIIATLLLCLYPAWALAGQGMGPGPGVKAYASGSTEVTIYSSTADGYVYYEENPGTWASVRAAATGSGVDAAGASIPAMAEFEYDYGGEDFWSSIQRAFLYFDTSSLPDGATIDSVVLHLNYANDAVGSPKWSAQTGTQADTLTTADFDSFSGNTFGQTITLSGAPGYRTITFNAEGLAAINTTGATKICVREYDHDYLNSSPASGARHLASFYPAETNGTTADPKLVITYH